MFKSNHVLAFTMNKYHRIAHRIHDTWCIRQCLQDLHQIPYHPCMVYIPTFIIQKKTKNAVNIPVPWMVREFQGSEISEALSSFKYADPHHFRGRIIVGQWIKGLDGPNKNQQMANWSFWDVVWICGIPLLKRMMISI